MTQGLEHVLLALIQGVVIIICAVINRKATRVEERVNGHLAQHMELERARAAQEPAP